MIIRIKRGEMVIMPVTKNAIKSISFSPKPAVTYTSANLFLLVPVFTTATSLLHATTPQDLFNKD